MNRSEKKYFKFLKNADSPPLLVVPTELTLGAIYPLYSSTIDKKSASLIPPSLTYLIIRSKKKNSCKRGDRNELSY